MQDFGPLPEGFTAIPPITEMAKTFESGVEAWLDAFARSRSYKDIVSAASYVASKNEYFRAEAEYAADLRDRTWEWANAYMNAVLTGQKEIPVWDAFVLELTQAMQPEWPVPDNPAIKNRAVKRPTGIFRLLRQSRSTTRIFAGSPRKFFPANPCCRSGEAGKAIVFTGSYLKFPGAKDAVAAIGLESR